MNTLSIAKALNGAPIEMRAKRGKWMICFEFNVSTNCIAFRAFSFAQVASLI